MARRNDLRSRSGQIRGAERLDGRAVELLETRVMLSVNVAIDTSQHFQKIEGLGTSDADAPALYESAAFQKMYYQDLGASILRVPFRLDALEGPLHQIWSPVTLGPDIQADIAHFNFQLPDVQQDGALAAASKTYALDSSKLIGSLWTPPHWMKGPELNPMTGQPDGVFPTIEFANHDSAGGTLVDTPDNLRQFALYVTAYVKGFEQTYGVPFYAISLQNELAFSEPYSSCVYTPQIYVDALKAVHDAFVQYGVTTKIIGPDDVGVGPTTVPWLLWRQMQYINAVRADPVAMADLSAYSIHGYADDPNTPGRSPTMWQQYLTGRSAAQYPDPWNCWFTGIANDGKESWETENQTEPQTWAGALTMAENAQDALVVGNVSTWMYWQTADGSPASDQSLTGGTDETTQKFAAAEQFFRYIRPDSYRVAATPSDPTGVYVSAFVQAQQHTLTTVLINTGAADQTVNLSVAGSNVTSFGVDRRTSATDTFVDEGPVPVVNGVATILLPAGSIVTLQGATAVRTDRATQGNWTGVYGHDGYVLFGGSSNLPAYAQVTASGQQQWTWDPSPTDPRAPKDPASPSGRIAACDYSGSSFTLDVNLTDGSAHQVALYLLDYDKQNRAEHVQVTDAATGAVLDDASVSDFANGQWLVLNLSGHVTITLSNAGGVNAVASGLFFDPAAGPQSTAATFVKSDAATGGRWAGVYGADGYSIPGGTTSLPAYATVSTVNASTYTWTSNTNDPRAPQPAPGATSGIAATEYAAGSFTINLNMVDGKSHQVAAYLLDWDNQGRTETVQVADADTGTVLDTRTVSGFAGGQWLVWDLSGRVTITFTHVSGPNAVLSGLAFDAALPATPAAATFVQNDATTLGNWTGTYGADGYSLLGAGASLPSYARLSTALNQPSWVWDPSTADPRALQNGPGSASRIAACDYAAQSFTLDLNLVDGKSHRVALYMVDYDHQQRAQTVQIADANSGVVLDTQSVGNFANGQYLVWNVTGHVKVTVTLTAGPNAVASGIFFG